MKEQNYQLEDLQQLYTQVANHKGNLDPHTFKQQINSISRILILDDQRNGDFFEYVFEVKLLECLLDIFSQARDKQIVNVILGFFTILLTNLTQLPTVNALLSHPAVACLTLSKFVNMKDQVADYFINFLKVLSRKLSSQNLHLFFNKRYATFPLLSQSIRFYNHPDRLVRTTCRNIILTFAQLENKLLHSFMVGFPFCTYFVHQCNFIKECWFAADKTVRTTQDNAYQLAQLQSQLQDHQEVLIFLDDLLSLKIPEMPEAFISAFLNECLNPLMVSLDHQAKDDFSIQLCLYVLMGLFKHFNDGFAIDTLALVIFGKYHTKELNQRIYTPVPCLLSYDNNWKFKGYWDSYQERISKYCIQTYHSQGTKGDEKQQTSFIGSWMNKLDNAAVFGITNSLYEKEIEKVESIFGYSIIRKNQNLNSKGAAANVQELLAAIHQQTLNLEECQINSVSGTILSYLNSKDDTLVMLTLGLFAAFFQNRKISPKVLEFCRLSLKPQNRDFQSVIKIQKIVISCIKLFSVDPPCYRICTYLQARDLCKTLSSFYSPKDFPLSGDIINALKCGLKTAIDRISSYLYNSKQWEKAVTVYMFLLKKSSKRRNKTLKTFGLISNSNENGPSISSYTIDHVYENEAILTSHKVVRDFWIYLIAKDLLLEFNGLHHFINVELKATTLDSCKYEKGKTFEESQGQVIPAQYRINPQGKYVECGLILLTGYLLIVEKGVVQYCACYDQIVGVGDISDARKLLLKEQETTIWLRMSSISIAKALLSHISEERSTLMRYKLSQIIKEVELLLKTCTK